MTDLLLHDIDKDIGVGLRRRAERHGRSVEAEARDILRAAVRDEGLARPGRDAPDQAGLGTRIAALFAEDGLEEGELPVRPFAPIKPLTFDP